MANIKSAIKRHKQSQKARVRNRHDKTVMKHTVADLREALDAKKPKKGETHKLLVETQSTIAHMASKGLIKKENAARRISRLAKAVNATFAK